MKNWLNLWFDSKKWIFQLQAEFPVTFKCHGCKNPFKANKPVLQCKTGHNFCEACKDTVKECHECKEAFLGTRNLALENMVNKAHESDDVVVTPTEEKTPVKLTLGKVNIFWYLKIKFQTLNSY